MDSIIDFLKQWDLLGFVFAGLISLIITLIYNAIKSLVCMKRKPYNISKKLVSTTVYDNREEGDFSITVKYRGEYYNSPLTLLRIRLLNDGQNDFFFSQRCSRPICISIPDIGIVDYYTEADSDIQPVLKCENGKYLLSWSLLKVDESIDLIFVAKTSKLSMSDIDFDIRADGLNRIKSPEYRVWPQLWPILLASLLMGVCFAIFAPSKPTFLPFMSERTFWLIMLAGVDLLFIILVLIQRIQWLKE